MLEVHPHFVCPVSIFVVGKLPSLLVKFHICFVLRCITTCTMIGRLSHVTFRLGMNDPKNTLW